MTTLGPRFVAAVALANDVHRGQVRKAAAGGGGTTPYVAHLLAVAALVLEAQGSEDEAIAALLHDALEDHPDRITAAGLAAELGSEVARIVVACSDVVGQPDPQHKPPWRARKEAYLARLEEADPSVLRVSLADKLHNATSLRRELERCGAAAWSAFKAGRNEQLWYHEALVALFQRRWPGSWTDEYAAVVARVRVLAASSTA